MIMKGKHVKRENGFCNVLPQIFVMRKGFQQRGRRTRTFLCNAFEGHLGPKKVGGCFKSEDQSVIQPMILVSNKTENVNYENCMHLKSMGIFVSGKFKLNDGSERFCPGWGKLLKMGKSNLNLHLHFRI